MPRLRTTSTFSLLALVIGVAGTGWLSTRTAVWPGTSPSALAAAAARQPGHAARPAPASGRGGYPHHASRATAWRGPHVDPVTRREATASAALAPAPALIPVSTPAAATPYARLRGHLDGSVLLQVAVDGNGRVRQASVAHSSGDPVLDAHALNVVDGWRFAVPASYPDGFSGELPMRFETDTQLARTP